MLQRSVTERRRLASGRPNVSRVSDMRRTVGQSDARTAGGINPDCRAVRAQLPLPHGYAPLDFLDDIAAGLDRRHAVLLGAAADRAEKDTRAAALGGGDLGEQSVEGNG